MPSWTGRTLPRRPWSSRGPWCAGVADMPFTRQYRNTVPYLYFLQQQFQWGLGYALGLVVALGAGLCAF